MGDEAKDPQAVTIDTVNHRIQRLTYFNLPGKKDLIGPGFMSLLRLIAVGVFLYIVFLLVNPRLGQSLFGLTDWMFMSGLLAVVLSLAAFVTFIRIVSRMFSQIYARGIVSRPRSDDDDGGPRNRGFYGLLESIFLRRPDGQTYTYLAFIDDFERAMNGFLGQAIFALLFMGFVVLIWIDFPRVALSDILRYPVLIPGFIVLLLIGAILGILGWRMFTTAVFIMLVGARFELDVIYGHPDQCGGLEPVGQVCLWNALIVLIPAMHVGGWIILSPFFPQYGDYWPPLLWKYAWILVIIGFLTFAVPLWRVHQFMSYRRQLALDWLDDWAKHRQELFNKILDTDLDQGSEQDKIEQIAAHVKDLGALQKLPEEFDDLPQWPVNVAIARRFTGAMIPPLLGLVGGLSPLQDVLENLASVLLSD